MQKSCVDQSRFGKSSHASVASELEHGSASHSAVLAAGDAAPEWVQLLPAGTFGGIDGRGPYLNNDAAAVIAATKEVAAGKDLPIDYGHTSEEKGAVGASAPAAGWMTDFEARNNGEVWARVSWTKSGNAAVADREYRFISPVFYFDKKTREVLAISGAGLTNRPNLQQLKSLNSRQSQEEPLKTFQQRIAEALGLDESTAEDAVVARCTALKDSAGGFSRVAQTLKLGETANADQVIQAINAREVATTPDPEKYVPRTQYDATAEQLRAAQSRESERVVADAIAAGKLTPAQKDWGLSYHAKDPAGFQAFVEKQPVLDLSKGTEHAATGDAKQLDDVQKDVCARLAIDEEKFVSNISKES